ncbi:hypothetical protein ScPMuIL_009709 [Solemya velum]
MAKSNASWTTGRVYNTCVLLDTQSAKPLGGYCYCTAGAGEACCHIAAVLFGIEEFVSLGLYQVPDQSTTEALSYWINPKGSKVEPKKLVDITLQQSPKKNPRTKKVKASRFDPRAPDDRVVNYQAYLRLISEMREANPHLPFNTIVQPSKFRPVMTDSEAKAPTKLPCSYETSENFDPMVPAAEVFISTSVIDRDTPGYSVTKM